MAGTPAPEWPSSLRGAFLHRCSMVLTDGFPVFANPYSDERLAEYLKPIEPRWDGLSSALDLVQIPRAACLLAMGSTGQ
jgi:hypothetical protein